MGTASLEPAVNFDNAWRKVPVAPQVREIWDLFDNPVGKMMIALAVPSKGFVVWRMHDLDAFHRLVGLRIALLAAEVDTANIQSFVENADARFHDPYTGKPMVWDSVSKRLSAQASEDATKRRHKFVDKGRIFVQM